MNTEIITIFLGISLLGMFAFWLMYHKANNTGAQAKEYLLTQLQDSTLKSEERQIIEGQLSELLQKNKSSGSFKITALLAAVIIISSFVLYKGYGTPNAEQLIAAVGQGQTLNQSTGQTTDQAQAPQMSMQDAIAQLEQRLAENPQDVDGQMLYARSQISLKNYDKAVTAYRKSNALAPNEAVILTELAEAIALANNNRSFLGEPEGLLAQAVELEPTNQKALWLLGMTFYEKKDFQQTNQLWTKLYDLMSNEGAKKQLSEQLVDVRKKLGIPSDLAKTKEQTDIPKATNNAIVTVQINLDELLIDKLEGKRALLYVYTKETSGMPMPIAVIRQPLEQISKTFPISISFSDANNLQPSRKLSSFKNIIIGARISFTGNAIPQAGDLQSTEIKVDIPNSEAVELVIDKIR